MSSSSYVGALGAGADRDFSGHYLFPASPAQRRLWFLCELEPHSNAAYNVVSAVRLSGALDRLRLQQAVDAVLARHESLRTGVALVDGAPQQVVLPSALVALPLVDLRDLPPDERDRRVLATAREEAGRPFALHEPPLVRLVLLRTADEEHVLVATVHHLVCDGWSIELFYRDLATAYSGSPLPEPPIQYADYVAWLDEHLGGERLDALLAHWAPRLAGLDPLDVPSDRPRPPVRTVRGGVRSIDLPGWLRDRLVEVAGRCDATLYMVLLAAFKLLLAAHSGRADIAVGTPVAGREHPDAEELIGFFANTLVLRTDLDTAGTFTDAVAAVRATCLDAFSHQEMPFDRLVEHLRPPRDLARTPLFQVMFAVQNTPGVDLELPGLRLSPVELPATSAKFDLWLTGMPAGDALRLRLEHNADLFDAGTVDLMLARYLRLLEDVARDPHASVPALFAPDAQESAVVEAGARKTGQGEAGTPAPWWELVADRVRRTPTAPAVSWPGSELTYGELDERAARLAGRLAGVSAGACVAVRAPLGADLAVAVLAVLRSGAALLVADPAAPPEHVDRALAAARPDLVLTPEDVAAATGEPAPPRTPHPDGTAWLDPSPGAADFVEATHAVLTRSAATLRDLLGEGRRVLLRPAAPVVPSLLAVWAAGGCAVVAGDAPVVLTAHGDQDAPEGGRVLWFGAAPATRPDGDHWTVRTAPGAGVVGAAPAGAGAPSLGPAPVGLTRHVLGPDLRPVAPGLAGELWLGGPALPRGLRGAAGRTAALLVPAPGGGRRYRTGDVVRRRPDGALELIGRASGELRVGDRWVDPVRVASALAEHPVVREAAATPCEFGDDVRLVGWLVLDRSGLPGAVTDAEVVRRVRQDVAGVLPAPDVPAVFGVLDALPLRDDGRVDARALQARRAEAVFGAVDSTPPRNAEESRVVAVLKELLNTAEVGVHANFFGLGGHSLLAAKLMARVRAEFDVQVPVREFFKRPTAAGLADVVRTAREGKRDRRGRSGTRAALAGLSDDEVTRLLGGLQ